MSEEEKPKEEKPKEEEVVKPEADLAQDLIRVILSHGDNQPLKLTEALGSLAMAGLEVYHASKNGARIPAQPEGDGKTEKA